MTSVVQHTPGDRASKIGRLCAGDIVVQVDGQAVLKQKSRRHQSGGLLFGKDDTAMELLVFSQSQIERPQNAGAIKALIQQDRASRKDTEYARRTGSGVLDVARKRG